MANTQTPAATVTTPANAGGSNKSTPAPKVAIPAGIKKWLWLVVVAVAVIVGIVFLVSSVKRDREKEKEAQKSAQALSQQQSAPQRASGDCTYSRPCENPVGSTGSTETVHVKVGYRTCFDPPVWANPKVGFKFSSGGGPEEEYRCTTAREVVDGLCKEPISTFRFVPKEGAIPPRHWFTNESGIAC